jgi:hypothetical protein
MSNQTNEMGQPQVGSDALFCLPGVEGYGLDEYGEPDCDANHNPIVSVSDPGFDAPIEIEIQWGARQLVYGSGIAAGNVEPPEPAFLYLPRTPEMAAALMRMALMCLQNVKAHLTAEKGKANE